MKSANKKCLAQKIAISSLMKGNDLNKKGLDCILYFYQPESFENKITKCLKELGIEEVGIETFYNNLTNCLIKLNDAKYILEFTEKIPKLSKEKMAKAIIGTRDLKSIVRFANEIDEAPIMLLAEELCSCAGALEIYSFAVEVKNAPINILQEEFETRICRMSNQNPARRSIIEFAKNVKGANLKRLERIVTNLNNSELIYEFAVNVSKVSIDNLTEALIKAPKSNKLIIQYVEEVHNIKEEHIIKLAEIVKYGEDPDEMLEFADLYSCPNEVAKELIECAIIKK